MVMLANYESIRHCTSFLTSYKYVYCRNSISPRIQRVSSCAGFLQTSGFSTGFANNKYTSAVHVSSASVGLATI